MCLCVCAKVEGFGLEPNRSGILLNLSGGVKTWHIFVGLHPRQLLPKDGLFCYVPKYSWISLVWEALSTEDPHADIARTLSWNVLPVDFPAAGSPGLPHRRPGSSQDVGR